MPDRSIAEWLHSIGLSQYADLFLRNEIGMDVLADLAESDLEKLGIALGSRKRLLKAIQMLGTQPLLDAAVGPAPRVSVADAERRQLTVLFCDLVGFN